MKTSKWAIPRIAGATDTLQLEDYLRTIPDFPQKGIQFKDITPLLRDPAAFHQAIDSMSAHLKNVGVNTIVAIEARGFILGAPIALGLSAHLVPIRKAGKLPAKTFSEQYSLEYGSATIEMHQDGIEPGDRVAIVDDVLATGGTLLAAAKLIEKAGAQVVAISVLIELLELKGRDSLRNYTLKSLLTF